MAHVYIYFWCCQDTANNGLTGLKAYLRGGDSITNENSEHHFHSTLPLATEDGNNMVTGLWVEIDSRKMVNVWGHSMKCEWPALSFRWVMIPQLVASQRETITNGPTEAWKTARLTSNLCCCIRSASGMLLYSSFRPWWNQWFAGQHLLHALVDWEWIDL